jgi:hypothetical protein
LKSSFRHRDAMHPPSVREAFCCRCVKGSPAEETFTGCDGRGIWILNKKGVFLCL